MPRQLPWKVNGLPSNPSPRPRKTESPAANASRPGSDGGGLPASRSASRPKSGTSTPVGGKSRRSLTSRPDRSPSTSPPPEPISEDFMIEGLSHDDRYRMVEDELLGIAHDFTKHLHAAEYQRLKALAATRNADMIRTISRPVTGGRMTELVRKRRSALELAAGQRRGMKRAGLLGKRKGRDDGSESDDDDEEAPWAGTSLQGLMDSPRKRAVPLPAGSSNLGASGAGQRGSVSPAVARFASRVGTRGGNARAETTTDEDEDDLDTQPNYRSRPSVKVEEAERSTLSLNQKAASIEAMARRREPTVPPRSTPAVKVEESLVAMSARQTVKKEEEDDEEEDDFIARIRKRREQQRKRREGSRTGDDKNKRGGSSAVDAIPLF